jgi:hypothetical protein
MCIADEESKVISFTPAAARAAAKNLTVTATNYKPLTSALLSFIGYPPIASCVPHSYWQCLFMSAIGYPPIADIGLAG